MSEELIQPTLKEVWARLFKRELFYKFDENDTVVDYVTEIVITPEKFVLKGRLGGVATIFRKELNRVF